MKRLFSISFIYFLTGLAFLSPPPSAHGLETYHFQRMWPVLKSPVYLNEPIGIEIGPDGYIYIADHVNNQVQKLTSAGDPVSSWGQSGDGEGEFKGPYDVAVDAGGRIYISDYSNHRVQVFSGNGNFMEQWRFDDNGEPLFDKPSGIAISPDGDIYVADTGEDRISRFTPDGRLVIRWGQRGGGDGEFHWPRGVAVSPDGQVLVVDQENHRIQRFTADGRFIDSWGERGSGPGMFNEPDDIAVDAAGTVYVTDRSNTRVQRFEITGQFLGEWGHEGQGNGEFKEPSGIAISKDGNVFVVDSNLDAVQVFDADGVFLNRLGRKSGPGYFSAPDGLTLSPNGSVYVADTGHHRIQQFDINGQFIRQWGSEGSDPGEFSLPARIAADADGNLYVSDFDNDRIQVFGPDGEFIRSWGESSPGSLNLPYGIAVGPDGRIYMADKGNNRIQVFEADGRLVSVIPEENGPKWPEGIAVNSEGVIFVTDYDCNCIKQYTQDGTFLGQIGGPGDGELEFDIPNAISLDTDGNLYVTDMGNHRIQKLSPAGELITAWGAIGSNPGQLRYPGATAVAPDGKVYVADNANHRIQVFSPDLLPLKSRAIIVEGGGPYDGNKLWSATRMAARLAYRALTHQGFDKETITYLSADTEMDLDGNSQPDDVAGIPSLANFETAIAGAAGADKLVFYLVDHGGESGFRLSEDQYLAPDQLAGWLDRYQDASIAEVIVVIDACQSGRFVSPLQADDTYRRLILTSTSETTNAHFIEQGSLSFSGFFWTQVFTGRDVESAFSLAREAIGTFAPNQSPQLSARGISPQISIGYGTDLGDSAGPPFDVSIADGDPEAGTATVRVEVDRPDEVARIQAVAIPPGYAPETAPDSSVLGLPSVQLTPDSDGRYVGTLSGLTEAGDYRVAVYLRDRFGNTFSHDPLSLSGGSAGLGRVVLVAGQVMDPARRPVIEEAIRMAWAALSFQGYSRNDIFLISTPESAEAAGLTPDGPSSAAGLNDALSFLAGPGGGPRILHLIGDGTSDGFRLSASDTIEADWLGRQLDGVQAETGGRLAVIIDSDGAGCWLPAFSSPDSVERVVIAGAACGRPARFSPDGRVSFSSLFWREIFNGESVRRAFRSAGDALGAVSGQSAVARPLIDDNGNGVGNERRDGRRAMGWRIGHGIRLADNGPAIGGPPADVVLDGQPEYTFSVDSVGASGSVSAVWATVLPPSSGLFSTGAESLRTVGMTPVDGGGYEGSYTDFSVSGRYAVTIYAADAAGRTSSARSFTVDQRAGPDAHEPDDLRATASDLGIGHPDAQYHSLHDKSDGDWVRFYARADTPYTIQVGCADPDRCGLEVARFDSDGELVDERSVTGAESWTFTPSADGLVYLRVRGADDGDYPMAYHIEVFRPIGPISGFLLGRIIDSITGAGIAEARIGTDHGASAISRSDGRYLMVHEPGEITIDVQADGYPPEGGQRASISEGGTTVVDIRMAPESPDLFPTAVILSPEGDLTVPVGSRVSFVGSVTGGDPPFDHAWSFAGAAPDLNGAETGPVSLETVGTYPVVFRVTDADGDTDSAGLTLTVTPSALSAEIIEPAPGTRFDPDGTTTFRASASGGTLPYSFRWDFDGAAADGEGGEVSVSLSEPGSVFVTLTVEDADGTEAHATIEVIVHEPKPIPAPLAASIFAPSPGTEAVAEDPVFFEGTAFGGTPPYAYRWDFGEGAEPRLSESVSGTVIFETSGSRTVSLRVIDAQGVVATADARLTIIGPAPPPSPEPVVTPGFPEPGATGVSLTPSLAAEVADDAPPSAWTRWQVATDPGFGERVWDRWSGRPMDEMPLPAFALQAKTTYHWRVGIADDPSGEVDWSETSSFTTQADPADDLDVNGVPDWMETAADELALEAFPAGVEVRCLQTAAGNARVCVGRTENGSTGRIAAIRTDAGPGSAGPVETPLGIISFRIDGLSPGEPVSIRLRYSKAPPAETRWTVFDPVDGPLDGAMDVRYEDDRRTVTLTLADGGSGDADGVSNGVIIHSGGPNTSAAVGPSATLDATVDEPGGMGCFIRPLP